MYVVEFLQSAFTQITMNLSDLEHIRRKSGGEKSLLERARKYIGAVKSPLKTRNTAAQAKGLVRAAAAAKHPR